MRRGRTVTLACLASGIALHAMAAPPPQPSGAAELARRMVRPLVLPRLWTQLAAASAAGDPHAMVGVGAAVAGLLPQWTDGISHFAWTLAAADASTDEERVARVLDAVAWLRDESAIRGVAGAELLLTASALVNARIDETLAPTFRRMTGGRSSVDVAFELADAAVELDPTDELADLSGHLAVRAIAGAVLGNAPERAESLRQTAIARLRGTDPVSTRTRAALTRLGPISDLQRSSERWPELESEPALRAIVNAIRRTQAR